MFHSAQWKAYLQRLHNRSEEEIKEDDNIYHILHAEKLWYTQEIKSEHQKEAEAHLAVSDELMKDCTRRVDDLEETLANTPKPSEALNWNLMTLGDLM